MTFSKNIEILEVDNSLTITFIFVSSNTTLTALLKQNLYHKITWPNIILYFHNLRKKKLKITVNIKILKFYV